MSPQQTIKPYSSGSGSKAPKSIAISIIAIIVAIIAIVFAGLAWQQLSSLSGGLQKKILRNQLQAQAHIQIISKQLQKQREALSTTEANLNRVLQMADQTQAQKGLSEITYLLHLADLHLRIGHDTASSLQLLQTARNRAKALNDPALIPLQRAINLDIEKLKKAPQVNVAMILSQLTHISETIKKISLLPTKIQPDIDASQKEDISQEPWYERVLHSLKDLVVIRHIQEPIKPLLSEQQEAALKNNIELKLSQAEWAVLHKNPKLYQHSLQQVEKWLKAYYRDKPQVNPLLAQIKSLSAINISPKLPTISDSLNTLAPTISAASRSTPSKSQVDSTQKSKPKTKRNDTSIIKTKPETNTKTTIENSTKTQVKTKAQPKTKSKTQPNGQQKLEPATNPGVAI